MHSVFMGTMPSGVLQFTNLNLNVKVFCNGQKGVGRGSKQFSQLGELLWM